MRSKSTGKLHAQCKQCYKTHRETYAAEHYSKYQESYRERAKIRRAKFRRQFQINLLTYLADKECVLCGENDVRVLEFDHLDPANKAYDISRVSRLGYSWERTLLEINKCRILCANCHKKHTAQQFKWYKAELEAPTGIEPV